jgi:hypothetical protein
MKQPPTVEDALADLQRLVRLPGPVEPVRTFMFGRIPDDLATEDARSLSLPEDEVAALEDVRYRLSEDLRFEYIDKGEREATTWRFLCMAFLRQDEDHVAAFVTDHARELERRTCFFPVVHLAVSEELALRDTRLIPAADAQVGAILAPQPQPEIASVIAVECEGTNRQRMRDRAAEVALHSLRVLRAGLREEHFVHDRQLRFRLGVSYWFSDGLSGWQTDADTGWGFELDANSLGRVAALPIASLPVAAKTDIERCANRSLQWFEQSQLAVDPVMEIMLLTIALEAILGRKSERLKGRGLALRRAVLAVKTAGHFSHPARFYLVYDKVRSVAVHGGEPPVVDRRLVDEVSWDVRLAVNQFLDFARGQRYLKRSRLLDALDDDPAVAEIEGRFLPGNEAPGGRDPE